MTTHRDPMFDDDERRLAEQLARIAPRAEPSAELDARILAMAGGDASHVRVPAASARRRPRRWPVWLGVAASLTAVAGLVWRLEPILHPGQPVRYEAPASVAADNDPNGQRAPVEYVASQAAAEAVPPPPPPMMSAPVASAPPESERRNAQATAKTTSPLPAADAAREAEEAAVDAAAPAAISAKSVVADRDLVQEMPRRPAPATVESAAAITPPPAPPAPVAASAMAGSRAAAQPTEAPAARVAAPAPPPAAQPPAPTEDRAGFDARPPTTADSPEVRLAWLARIRELRDAGDIDEAKTSLKAFVQRYPKAEIPADLKPLLPPPSTSTPSP